MTTCLITGCAMRIGGSTLWGDLHELGDVYIFNAVTGPDGKASAAYNPQTEGPDVRWIEVFDDCPSSLLFERRGIIVVSKAATVLNDVAREFLAGWEH